MKIKRKAALSGKVWRKNQHIPFSENKKRKNALLGKVWKSKSQKINLFVLVQCF